MRGLRLRKSLLVFFLIISQGSLKSETIVEDQTGATTKESASEDPGKIDKHEQPENHDQKESPAVFENQRKASFRILMGGDTHFVWGVRDHQKKYFPEAPFAEVAHYFAEADVSMLNLETAMTDQGDPIDEKSYTFNSNPGNADVLKRLGVDVAILGNNHSMDYGEIGIKRTCDILQEAGIQTIGAGENLEKALQPVILEKEGFRIAILSFSLIGPNRIFAGSGKGGVAPARFVYAGLRKVRRTADLVIVQLHWGVEYSSQPEPDQINLGRKLILNGADVVVGHHPHIPQGVELYRKGVILYSLGNFVFGSVTRLQTNNFLAQIELDRTTKKMKGVRLLGISGIFGEVGHAIHPLNQSGARDLWARTYLLSRQIRSSTVDHFRLEEDGSLFLSTE